MYVCVCKAVSDKRIHRAVGDGHQTLRDLVRELGVGTCCGKCVSDARGVLDTALAAHKPLITLAELKAATPLFA